MKVSAITIQNYAHNQRSKTICQRPSNCCKKVSFGGIIKSIPMDTYLIRMASYGTDWEWAQKMNRATESISSMMQNKLNISNIIFSAENFVHDINAKETKYSLSFGVKKSAFSSCFTIVNQPNERGYEYLQRYHEYLQSQYRHIIDKCGKIIYIPQSNAQYPEAKTCQITVPGKRLAITILHGRNNPARITSNLELVKKAYNLLEQKEKPTKKEVVDTAATIQWLIAQETPYIRGSDSIANLLSRSLMHKHGIQLSPLKRGVSCDFEAFYKNLDDYIKIYPTLFEKNPLA